jgi:hypothetical protein
MLYAYALAGALIAPMATWAFLAFPGLLIWGAFIGWAGFLHSGGDKSTIKTTVVCMCFGAFLAWGFSMLLIKEVIPWSIPVAAATFVAVIVPLIIISSKIKILSIVPACFYGFASSFAFLTQTPGKLSIGAMTSFGLDNVIVVIPISMTIGVLLGYAQTLLAAVISQYSLLSSRS